MTTKQLRTEQLESNAGVERGFSACQDDIKAAYLDETKDVWQRALEANDVTFTAWEKAAELRDEASNAYFFQVKKIDASGAVLNPSQIECPVTKAAWKSYHGQQQVTKAAWKAYQLARQLEKEAWETHQAAWETHKGTQNGDDFEQCQKQRLLAVLS